MSSTIESCEELLAAMVRIDSVNSNISGKPDAELELGLFMETQAKAMGFSPRRLPIEGRSFNLLIEHKVSDAAPWLLFESHLDTVTVAGMTVDPFAAKIQGGRMYGRGACDTKATGASMLLALRQYAGQKGGANNVALVLTTDEELFKTGVRAFVQKQLPALSWRPGGVVVGEPTLLKPVVAHNGMMRWKIQTVGRAAHSADPSRGRSAISMMVKVIQAVESRYIPALTRSHPLTGKAQCSINVIHGGVQVNVIPELCEILLDRRVVPGEDHDAVQPALEALLDELRRADPHFEAKQMDIYSSAALDPVGGETFAGFVRGVLRGMKLSDEPCGVPFGTDASDFSTRGIPAVVLGPGDIAQAHTADEWIELSQLPRAVEVYLELMRTPMPARGNP